MRLKFEEKINESSNLPSNKTLPEKLFKIFNEHKTAQQWHNDEIFW